MEQQVWRLRTWIYIIGIIAFCAAMVYKCSKANASEHSIEQECSTEEDSEDDAGNSDFWPPDMIPHPNPPWDQPSGPKEPPMS